jgi:hypothetical protein
MIAINEVAFGELPFLVATEPNNIARIEAKKTEVFVELQIPLKKSDTDVFDETKYNNQEKLLIGYYIAYQVIQTQALQNISTTNEDGQLGSVYTKKEKAAVVEIEYDMVKDYAYLSMKPNELLYALRKKICSLAKMLNVCLLLCSEFQKKHTTVPVRYFPD